MWQYLKTSRLRWQGICDTLQAYGVSELLYDIACAKTALLAGTAEHHLQHLPDDAQCFGSEHVCLSNHLLILTFSAW